MDRLLYIRIIAAIIISSVFVVIRSLRQYRDYGFSIISVIPILNKRYFDKRAKKEIKDAEKGLEYRKIGEEDKEGKKFQAFLMDLPKYQIEDNFVANHLRSLMKSAGVEYRQVVLIDKADVHDTCVWIRKHSQYFINAKGTYFIPWDCVKSVLYYDIVDSRPLIDLTDEWEWKNQEMCAEAVTGVTNTKTMLGQEKRFDDLQKTITYVLYGVGIIGLILIVSVYMQDTNTKKIIELLVAIQKGV